MPYLQFTKCAQLGILPGGVLSGEFAYAQRRSAPHMEDCSYQQLSFEGRCSGEEFRKVLSDGCAASLQEGFEVSLPAGEKVIPASHTGPRSIITLQVEPSSVRIVENSYNPGSIRLHFTDASGRNYRYFPITDLGFHDYAQRHRRNMALEALNEEIRSQKEIFLRIGLSRAFKNPQNKEGFWMQANGIYTFPKVLRYIRSYGVGPEK